ncbi:ATP synthase F1 subunit gamma [Sulfuriroseicoccus oceanibius]|uniref:ATP synthase gamma chain n=1 Tax=Sulfuriroseicoccus oceanibius TaxID=2707525 RepID=A0A6B3L9I4_9BACT|nr:ATP synthase F1 subunit gamma [Sulfuriroseicoccus oceanibius]QQL43882.1 ATP synthase F1 subunit gamma [Sulfuriroseicoccus oceanibius]
MANMRDIRRRIKSVKNTAQITRAMELVAASKMKKAQDQAVAGRSYAGMLNNVLASLTEQSEEITSPLMEKREGGKTLVVLVSTDKGLCGGLNTNLFKKVLDEANVPADAQFVSVGKKGRRLIAKLQKELVADFEVKDPVPFGETKLLARFLTKQFLEGKVDRVLVAYNHFVNTLSQKPTIVPLLPLCPENLQEVTSEGATATDQEYIFEPSQDDVFEHLLPLFVNFTTYQLVVEARASEHSARMVAMKSATDNAKGMIKDLTLEYNKLRQAAITAELLEISAAAKAME